MRGRANSNFYISVHSGDLITLEILLHQIGGAERGSHTTPDKHLWGVPLRGGCTPCNFVVRDKSLKLPSLLYFYDLGHRTLRIA